jgi:DNA-binding response OmpR family regulator
MLQTYVQQMVGTKILIVDDDQDIRRLLGLRLKSGGYEVAFAGDAISAVNMARKENPDLILLDLMLPAGDGYVVMERERLVGAGADAFFHKPFDHDELLGAIARALGRPA